MDYLAYRMNIFCYTGDPRIVRPAQGTYLNLSVPRVARPQPAGDHRDRQDAELTRDDYRRDDRGGPPIVGMGDHVPDFILRSFKIVESAHEETEDEHASAEG